MTEDPTTAEKSRKRDWIFLVLGIVLVLLPMVWFPSSPPVKAHEVTTDAPAVPAPKQGQTPTEPETDEAPADETIPPTSR